LDHDWLRGDDGHPARRISELIRRTAHSQA
jgi:hypothetical protein